MRIEELFDIKYGINLELDSCEKSTDYDSVNFVARTSENNGVVAKVKVIDGKEPQSAGLITCAGGGSVLSTFVQTKPFYSGRDLYVLTPKKEMSLEEKLFYCHAIKMNAYRYSYGRQANKTLKNINLPPLPIWLKKHKIDYSKINTKIKSKESPVNTTNWGHFIIGDLFDIVNGIKHPSELRTKGDLPLVSTSAANNGISDYISDRKEKYKNLLTIAYSGSVGATFYHKNYVFVGETVFALIPKFNLNTYIGMFFCAVFNLHNTKFDYGRKIIGTRYIDEKIKLPVDSAGNPDWGYMENYIKSLPYSDLI